MGFRLMVVKGEWDADSVRWALVRAAAMVGMAIHYVMTLLRQPMPFGIMWAPILRPAEYQGMPVHGRKKGCV